MTHRIKAITLRLAFCFLGAISAKAATFNIADGDVAGLVTAMQTANTNGDSPNVINLAPGGTYLLTAVAEISPDGTVLAGLPFVTSELTINGNGATIQASQCQECFEILQVSSGGLRVNGVTLTGGPLGALRMSNSAVVVQNSTITQNGTNQATANPSFGGIFNYCGSLTVLNSTISYNTGTSAYGGGGVESFNQGYCTTTTSISFSTIFENQNASGPGFNGRGDSISTPFGAPGTLVIKNSILASPTRALGIACYLTPAVLVSLGHNIAGDASCGLTGPGDLNSTDPLLGPTTNNGGPTPTDFPAANSPAIGGVAVGSCSDVFGNPVTTDQRGFPRPCPSTIGSVEFAGLYHICLLYDSTKAVHSGATDPIKLQLCDSGGNDLSSSSIVVHATGLTQTSTSIFGPVESPGNANPDSDFRFDPSLGPTGGYIFNLKTTGLTTGSYLLNFTVTGDSFVYGVPFQVK